MMDILQNPTVRVFFQVVVAALLGLFVGLERERVKGGERAEQAEGALRFAGIRTFSIASVTGYVSALLAAEIHPAIFVVALAVIGVFAALAHYASLRRRGGTTTEVAFVLTFLLGGLVHQNQLLLAAMLALLLTAVLATKPALHHFAQAVSREDIYSALKFGAISLVVLPLLPNRTYDPLDAVNPHRVWLMVVLISGISFLGYVLVKVLGARAGVGITGLLGGLVSSTATTVSFSRRSREAAELNRGLAVAILLACSVMYPRVVAIAAVVNAPFGLALALPLGVITILALLLTAIVHQRVGRRGSARAEEPSFRNPFELMPAIRFALVFAIVLVLVRLGERTFGESGILAVSFLSGTVEMDALTLSLAQFEAQGAIGRSTAVAAVVLASISNTIVKAAIVWMAGAGTLRTAVGIPLAGFAAASLVVFAALLTLR